MLLAAEHGCTRILVVDECPEVWAGGNGFFTTGGPSTLACWTSSRSWRTSRLRSCPASTSNHTRQSSSRTTSSTPAAGEATRGSCVGSWGTELDSRMAEENRRRPVHSVVQPPCLRGGRPAEVFGRHGAQHARRRYGPRHRASCCSPPCLRQDMVRSVWARAHSEGWRSRGHRGREGGKETQSARCGRRTSCWQVRVEYGTAKAASRRQVGERTRELQHFPHAPPLPLNSRAGPCDAIQNGRRDFDGTRNRRVARGGLVWLSRDVLGRTCARRPGRLRAVEPVHQVGLSAGRHGPHAGHAFRR